MKAQLISIGNELLIGDTTNTNATWIGQFLHDLGIEVARVYTISDDEHIIRSTVEQSMLESDLVITTGGLGPTHDDITKTTIANLFNVDLVQNEQVLNHIKDIFRTRNIPFSESNKWQAMVPVNSEVLFNKVGTAPGMWFNAGDCLLAVLPGVPHEMKYLMKHGVYTKIKALNSYDGYRHTEYIKTAGIGESTLSDHILGDVSSYLNEDVSIAFLPTFGEVTLRITGRGTPRQKAEKSTQALLSYIRKKAYKYIYGFDKNYSLCEAVGDLLKTENKKIAIAESCTGGLIAHSMTDISGSSAYFIGGIVSYANSMKLRQLNVSMTDLNKFGAVSKTVALQMAKGIAKTTGADVGLSTTGIAGPDGGTKQKPVGTVWIGFYSKEQHFAVKALFTKDRQVNKQRTKTMALELVRRVLSNIDEIPYSLKKEFA